MSCVNVHLIDPDECIGASLPKINGNFAALSAAVCELSSVPAVDASINVFDSPTIDLNWNASTRTLSADVKPDSIMYSNLASWQTLSGSPTLSAEAVQPRLAKAWVNFDGTTSPGTIRSQYNVSSVIRTSTGIFTVNFATPLADANYATSVNGNVGTEAQQDTWASGLTTSGFGILCKYQGASYNSPLFTVLVFGN